MRLRCIQVSTIAYRIEPSCPSANPLFRTKSLGPRQTRSARPLLLNFYGQWAHFLNFLPLEFMLIELARFPRSDKLDRRPFSFLSVLRRKMGVSDTGRTSALSDGGRETGYRSVPVLWPSSGPGPSTEGFRTRTNSNPAVSFRPAQIGYLASLGNCLAGLHTFFASSLECVKEEGRLRLAKLTLPWSTGLRFAGICSVGPAASAASADTRSDRRSAMNKSRRAVRRFAEALQFCAYRAFVSPRMALRAASDWSCGWSLPVLFPLSVARL